MKKLSCLLIVITLITSLVSAQAKHATLVINYQKSNTRDTLAFPIWPVVQANFLQRLPPDLVYQTKYHITDGDCQVTEDFTLNEPTAVILADLFGHEVYVEPGDTIYIRPLKKTKEEMKSTEGNPTMYNFTYEGPGRHKHAFFDSLSYVAGNLFMKNVSFKTAGYDINSFFDTATAQYNSRLHFLTACTTRYHLSKTFYQLAYTDITAAYIANLFSPLYSPNKQVTKQDLPGKYTDVINSFNYRQPVYFFTTRSYSNAIRNYIMYYKAIYDHDQPRSEQSLKEQYAIIHQEYKGATRDYLLSYLVLGFYQSNLPAFDTVYTRYKTDCQNNNLKKSIDSIITVFRSKPAKDFTDVLTAYIEDTSGKKTQFKHLLGRKPVIIDCWASWCKPCIEQFPYSKEFEHKYGTAIDFVYLSFDRASQVDGWKKGIAEQGLPAEKSYLLIDNFKSKFAGYFNLSSIPRYLVFDKQGKLVSDNGIRPIKKEEFEQQLNNLLR